MSPKQPLIASHRKLILSIMKEYGVDMTAIAKKADVAHTTITRLMDDNPDRKPTAFSALTLTKIKNHFPLAKETALPEPVVAIVDVLKILLSTFTSKGIASKNELLSRLTHQKAEYLEPAQKGALEVVEELLNYLTQIPPEAKGGLIAPPLSPSLAE